MVTKCYLYMDYITRNCYYIEQHSSGSHTLLGNVKLISKLQVFTFQLIHLQTPIHVLKL